MQNARIFLVEDDPNYVNALCLFLPWYDHQIVLKATNLEEALEVVNSGQLKEKDVNLAIVDGNFPRSRSELVSKFGGPIAAESIKATGLAIKIIAFTGTVAEASYGDVHFQKGSGGPSLLLEMIASL